MPSSSQKISLGEALEGARDTRCLEVRGGALSRVGEIFRRFFPGKLARVVADTNTFAAAGKAVLEAFRKAGLCHSEPLIFTDPNLYAEHGGVLEIEKALTSRPEVIPVAVGSGTINDMAKLAAHLANRPYLAVATAGSMDGYTAFGASIARDGAKRTFPCPAPLAVIADLDIIRAAPPELNAAGYADLLAKITAGADWLLADALGVEALDERAWAIIQGDLREALADPVGVRAGNSEAVGRLTKGLMLSGLAMQSARSSRPASGSEHQFSHLWDMQHHTHLGKTPLHGFKVGLGTLAIAALYEYLLSQPVENLNVNDCCARWPDEGTRESTIRELFGAGDLAEVALEETRAKAVEALALRAQLERLRRIWPELRERLRRQLLSVVQLKRMLAGVGAPTAPEQIGISRERFHNSFRLAYFIRRRFTILDVAARTGVLAGALDHI